MTEVQSQTHKPNGSGLHRFAQPGAWRGRHALERQTRSPRFAIPRRGESIVFYTDRVRAKPAVSPSLSMNIGMTAIGLGFWGLLFPHHVKRTLGIAAPASVVQAVFGVRELVTGYSLAGDPTRNGMLWARVAGDVFDLAVLGALATPANPKGRTAKAALAFVAGVTILDLVAAVRMTNVRRDCE